MTQQSGRTLTELVTPLVATIPGALACSLMGYDGMTLCTVGPDKEPYVDFIVELSATALGVKQLAERLPRAGALRGLTLQMGQVTALLQPLDAEFFLLLILSADALPGRAQYLVQQAAPAICQSLAS